MLAFSSDGRMIASASRDKTVRLWNTEDSCLIRSFDDHSGAVSSVVFHPSSGAFATASSDDTIRIWRLLR